MVALTVTMLSALADPGAMALPMLFVKNAMSTAPGLTLPIQLSGSDQLVVTAESAPLQMMLAARALKQGARMEASTTACRNRINFGFIGLGGRVVGWIDFAGSCVEVSDLNLDLP